MANESRLFENEVDAEAEEAGLATFAPFGYMIIVDSLAGGDVTKWNEVKALPYELVLTKRLLNQTKTAYEKNYTEIIKRKHKAK